MKLILIALLFINYLSIIAHSNPLDNEVSLPREYWRYMIGYKYEYKSPLCLVTWDKRSATFLLNGENCSQLEVKKIKEDAIASINFLKREMGEHNDFSDYYEALANGTLNKSQDNQQKYNSYPEPYPVHPSRNPSYDYIQMRWQGIGIWMAGCADYAEGATSPRTNLSNTYQGETISKRYPHLHSYMVKHLYDMGWKSAVSVNYYCHVYGGRFVDQYLLQVKDLRK